MSQLTLSISIVLYNNDRDELKRTIESVLNSPIDLRLYLLDNSPYDDLKDVVNDSRVVYIFNSSNLGFGKAHNIAMEKALTLSRYHLVLNPDVEFGPEVLTHLTRYMDDRPDVGLIQPKILNNDGTIQYVCKRLPSPMNLIGRRFIPSFFQFLIKKSIHRYEMREKDFDSTFYALSLSGCFMFFRTSSLKQSGLFDEQYFMYMEDVDLSRRMFSNFKNLYYPHVYIMHSHARGSYKLNKLFIIHIKSAVRYFNKYGWFSDADREILNNQF